MHQAKCFSLCLTFTGLLFSNTGSAQAILRPGASFEELKEGGFEMINCTGHPKKPKYCEAFFNKQKAKSAYGAKQGADRGAVNTTSGPTRSYAPSSSGGTSTASGGGGYEGGAGGKDPGVYYKLYFSHEGILETFTMPQ